MYVVCDSTQPVALCDTATVVITITAVGPVAVDDVTTTPSNTPVTTTPLTNDIPGSTPLDPASVDTIPGEGPVNGTVVVNPNGTVDYIPDPNFAGVDSFMYVVCDSTLPVALCDTATVVITVTADPPIAVDDVTTTPLNVPVLTLPLDNDSQGTNPLDPGSVEIITGEGPVNGSVVVNANGTVDYTPDNFFSGVDSFMYVICDSTQPTALCDTATVVITITAVGPVAVDDVTTTPSNTPVTTTPLTNDTPGSTPLDPASVDTIPGEGPTNGTVVVNGDGTVDYIPDPNFAGVDSFMYVVCDSTQPVALCDTATVVITVTADPPIAVDDVTTTPLNVPVLTLPLDNDSQGTNPLDPGSVEIIAGEGPLNGGVVVNANGTIDYTPDNNFSGVDSFMYVICDSTQPVALCDTATVVITITAVGPVAVDDVTTTPSNTPVTTTPLTNDTPGSTPLDPASVDTIPGEGPTNGTVVVNGDGTVDYIPDPNFAGVDSFMYVVCDSTQPVALCDTATVVITVTADPPIAVDDVTTTPLNTLVVTTPLDNDSQGTNPLDPGSVEIITGEGPLNGSVVVNANGTVDYTPDNFFSGVDSFMYVICDSTQPTALCDTATVVITITAVGPVAVDDVTTTPSNTPVTTTPLTNDTPGSTPLDPASVDTIPGEGPTNGTVVVNGDGTVDYIPDPNFAGVDSFMYVVCDSTQPVALCDTATVVITVTADPPIAVDDVTTTPLNTLVVTTPLDNDSQGTNPLDPGSVEIITGEGPLNGSVVVNANGTVDYTPDNFFSGVDSFMYVICDSTQPTALCDTATVVITITAVGPVAVDDVTTTPSNTPVTTTPLTNDTPGSTPLDPASVDTIPGEGPTNGTVVVNGDGTVDYIPDPNFAGVDSFMYVVCDSTQPVALCDTATVVITVTADPPIAVDDVTTTPLNTLVVTTPLDNDSQGTNPLDPGSVEIITGEGPLNGSVVVNANGTVDYTPDNFFSGVDSFMYVICDSTQPTALCDTATVVITITAVGPVAVDDVTTTPSNTPVTTTPLTNDTPGSTPLDPASVDTIPGEGPTNGTVVVNGDGTVDYIPDPNFAGVDSFMYVVCDSTQPVALCDTATVVITVTADPPIAVDDVTTTPLNTLVVTTPLDNDSQGTNPLDPGSVEIITGEGPVNGSVVVNANGTVDYTPDNFFSGVDSFMYVICDSTQPTALCDTATVVITITAVGPVAVDDVTTTPSNTPVTTTPLTNDTPGSTPLNPASVDTIPGEGPTNGTVVVNGDGTVDYIPDPNFAGVDSFMYVVCDSTQPVALCDTATVVITVTADPPIAVDDVTTTPLNVPVLTLPLDNDNQGTNPLDPGSVEIITGEGPLNGSVVVNANGTIDYTPDNNFSGVDSFMYVICDSTQPVALCDTATVVITITAGPPTAVDDVTTTPSNTPVTTTPLTNDIPGSTPLDPASVDTIPGEGPVNGTVVVNPNGTVDYTPDPNFAGVDSFMYVVCDSTQPVALCDTATVVITLTADPPIAVDDVTTTPLNVPVLTLPLDNDNQGTNPLDPGSVEIITGEGPLNGSVVVNANGTIDYTPDNNFSGVDSFMYVICDSTQPVALCDTATVVITITAGPPVAVDDVTTTPSNTPVTTTPLTNDIPGSTPLDPASVDTIPGEGPVNGTVVVNPNGTVDYTPDPNFAGVDSFMYVVCDSTQPVALCDTATVVITVTADPPIAVDDVTTTPLNVPVLTLPLDNDNQGTNPLDPGSVEIITGEGPLNGSVVVNANGTIDYTPDNNFSGVDSFMYVICDSTQPVALCDTATVVITITAGPPVAVDDVTTTPSNTPVTTTPLTNDIPGSTPLDPASVDTIPGEGPVNGTVVVNPNGTVDYTPDPNFAGVDSFMYVVCDSTQPVALCDTATVVITVTADPPIAVDDVTTTPLNVPVLTLPLDNDNQGTNPLDPGSVEIITGEGPLNGSVVVNANGTIDYTPDNNFSGVDSFMYVICDSTQPVALCDTATVVITITAGPPVAVDDVTTTPSNTPVTTTPLTNDIPGSTPLDPASVDTIPGEGPTNGTVVVNTNGTVDYTPDPNFAGVDSFMYVVCDSTQPVALCDTATVVITVTADPPIAVDDVTTTPLNVPVLTLPLDNDNQGTNPLDPGSVEIITGEGPLNGSVVVNANGTIDYTPDNNFSGVDSFMYVICDSTQPVALCDTATVVITITAGPPTAVDDVTTTPSNTPVTTTPLTNDIPGSTPLDPASVDTIPGEGPVNGTVVVNPNGTVDYTPDPNFAGVDSFMYVVCDSTQPVALCDTATVVITVTADPPIAVDDVTTTPLNVPVLTLPLDNDNQGTNPLDPGSVEIITGEEPLNGSVVVNANGTIDYTPDNNFSGVDSFMYVICDSTQPVALCDTATVVITITAGPPTAVDDVTTTPSNTPVVTTPLTNDIPGSTPLDPASVDTIPGEGPVNGTVVVNPNGTVDYTPDPNFAGVDSFMYVVCDSTQPVALCDTATVVITVTADPPIAVDDVTTTPLNVPVLTLPLDNDNQGTNPLDPGSVEIITGEGPLNGSVVVNANGTIDYTPDNNFSGVDSFMYVICDSTQPVALCDTATVVITITAGPPVAVDDVTTTPSNTPVTTTPLTNDIPGSTPLDPASVDTIPGEGPVNGTVVVNPNGTVDYTPDPNFAGVDSFMYVVCDSTQPVALCDTATVVITVTADPPIAVDDVTTTPLNVPVLTLPLDNDNQGTNPLDPGSVEIITGEGPLNGSVVVNANGTIDYTPDNNFSGVDSFMYVICDSTQPVALCDTATVVITITAGPPVAVDDVTTTPSNTPVTTTPLTNDIPGSTPLDPASVDTIPGEGPVNGTVVVNTNGTVDYTPDPNFAGVDSFMYVVCDSTQPVALCDTATVVITVTADPPIAVDDVTTTPSNTPVTTDPSDNDNQGTNPLDPSSVDTIPGEGPTNGTVDVNPDGTIDYTPDPNFSGVDSFMYVICDSTQPVPLCDTATVVITVTADPPVAVDDVTTTPSNTPVTTDPSDNDNPGTNPLDPSSVDTIPGEGPTNGTVDVNPDGTIDYTPDPNFSGVDSFMYVICDSTQPVALCDTATVVITVTADPPVAVDDVTTTPSNTPVTTDPSDNDNPGTNPLDPSSVDTIPGEGPTNGTVDVNPDGTIDYTPDPNFSGVDSFMYVICDSTQPVPLCDTATVVITVTADPPVAVDDVTTTPSNTPVTTDPSDNDNPGTNPLDPSSVDTIPGEGPTNGTVDVNPDGTVDYTPDPNFSGVDSFMYVICDSTQPVPLCDTATVVITVTADPPVAVDDVTTTPSNTPVTTDPSDNDNPGTNPLDPSSVDTIPGEGPTNGTVDVNPDGTIDYTPDPNFSGVDSFMYVICDSTQPIPLCDTATVVITVTADPPVAVDDVTTTPSNTPVTTDPSDNDNPGTNPLDPSSVDTIPGEGPTNGTVDVNPDGTIDYTPDPNFSGVDSFMYVICDSTQPVALCDTATVVITVTADPPVAVDDVTTTPSNTPVTTDPSNNDIPGTNPLDPTSVDTISGSGPTNGVVYIDEDDGTIEYTPDPNFSGIDSFMYVVCDSTEPEPLCDTATVVITVTADPPVAVDDVTTTPSNTPVTTDPSDNDSPGTNPLDPSSVDTIPGEGPTNGTVDVNPDGTIDYTPDPNFSGADSFMYVICDSTQPDPLCDMATVVINVTADPPMAVDDVTTTPSNTPVTTEPLDNDNPGTNPLDPGSVDTMPGEGPTNGTVDVNPDGTIDYTPDPNFSGVDSFMYVVCDSTKPVPLCDTATVVINVTADPPMAVDDVTTTPSNTPVTTDPSDNDIPGTNPLDPSSVDTIPGEGPTNGTVDVNPDGTIDYTPDPNFAGVDSFMYVVCDSTQPVPLCDTATVVINVTANPPVAVDDVTTTPTNSPVTTTPLGNDTPGTNPLDPTSVDTIPGGGPTNGTVVINPDGTVDYTPDTDYTGVDSFTYVVCDSTQPVALCDTATVVITMTCDSIQVKVLLEGPFNSGTGLMTTDLNYQHMLPGQDHTLNPNDGFNNDMNHTPIGHPYNIPPWNHAGTEGSNYGDPATNPGSILYPSTVTDWILVSVREADSAATSEIWKCAALLHNDGVAEFPGECPCLELDNGEKYYILIEHRNHLDVMSQALVPNQNKLVHDFTQSDSWIGTVFGGPFGVGQKFVGGEYVMYAGNGDTDPYGDENDIDSGDRTNFDADFNIIFEYFTGDHNLDGDVDSQDRTIYDQNFNNQTLIPH